MSGTALGGRQFVVGGDIIIAPQALLFFTYETVTFQNIYIENTGFEATGNCIVQGVLYGPGSLDLFQGQVIFNLANAVTTFPLAGGITIGAQANAYSNLTTGGVVATHRLALTPAHLDAAAGATGFGGLAYVPGVGGFFTGAVP